MKIDLMTLFPEMCNTVLNESIIGRARKNGKVLITCHNIRDYANNKHNKVDDAPFGGGMGMIMTAEPIDRCFAAIRGDGEKPYLVYLSPKGHVFNQEKAKELSKKPHIVLLCGHYEGVDERVLNELVDEEISIGDYVLTGGELPALVCVDAVCRMLPGVLSDDSCFEEESHYGGLLEYPQYTRPAVWHDRAVPDVLLSGDHAEVDKWRHKQSLLVTKERRPDLFDRYSITVQEKRMIERD